MGKQDDIEEDLDLPGGEFDDGEVGVDDADALVSEDVEDGPEEVGLDTEVGSARDAGDLGALIDAEDDFPRDPQANEPLGGFEVDLDDGDEEGGWTRDSEGSNEVWDSDGFDDDDSSLEDDGGLEGVDDSMSDGVTDELPPLRRDDDSEEEDPIEDDLGDDWSRDLSLERRMRPAFVGM